VAAFLLVVGTAGGAVGAVWALAVPCSKFAGEKLYVGLTSVDVAFLLVN
jgi:hypothetical protein